CAARPSPAAPSQPTFAAVPERSPPIACSARCAERLWVAREHDASALEQEPRDDRAEDKAADVGEECDAAAVRLRTEDPEVRLDELVEEPEAEEEPGRDPHGDDRDEPEHLRAGVENEVGAEHGRDRTARTEGRDARVDRGAEE